MLEGDALLTLGIELTDQLLGFQYFDDGRKDFIEFPYLPFWPLCDEARPV